MPSLETFIAGGNLLFNIVIIGTLIQLHNASKAVASAQISVIEERLKSMTEDLSRSEKWAEREKTDLTQQLNKKTEELNLLLKGAGVDLSSLTLGKQIAESAEVVRTTAEKLVQEMQEKFTKLEGIGASSALVENPEWELSAAMGAMSFGSYATAASHFDAYAKLGAQSWEASMTRAVAHANARGGSLSDLASLQAYNDAIALAPMNLSHNMRARLFSYRGAMLKRLDRLTEAEADLNIALGLATARYEVADIHYNLACVYAMRGDKSRMLSELKFVERDRRYMGAVAAHSSDYFKKYASDPDFKALIGGR